MSTGSRATNTCTWPCGITAHLPSADTSSRRQTGVETGTYLHPRHRPRRAHGQRVGRSSLHPPHDRRHPNPRLLRALRRCRHDPAIQAARPPPAASTASNPRPCAYSGARQAARPLHSRTRSVHFDSVSVMTASLRYAASFVEMTGSVQRVHERRPRRRQLCDVDRTVAQEPVDLLDPRSAAWSPPATSEYASPIVWTGQRRGAQHPLSRRWPATPRA